MRICESIWDSNKTNACCSTRGSWNPVWVDLLNWNSGRRVNLTEYVMYVRASDGHDRFKFLSWVNERVSGEVRGMKVNGAYSMLNDRNYFVLLCAQILFVFPLINT